MGLMLFGGFSFGKMCKNMTRLRKYCTGCCGLIGLHRVKLSPRCDEKMFNFFKYILKQKYMSQMLVIFIYV